MYTIKDLYDLDHTLAKDYLSQFTYPWEALKGIKDFILELGPTLGDDYTEVTENVWVHKTATVFPSAYLGAPCIIGPETEVRHGAFVRGSALVGANCVVGNSVELKNVKSDKKLVVVHNGTELIETGIKKFGAMLGDYVEVGCNAVCNPGTVIGRHSSVYPTSCVRGVIPENCIFKNSGAVIERKEN